MARSSNPSELARAEWGVRNDRRRVFPRVLASRIYGATHELGTSVSKRRALPSLGYAVSLTRDYHARETCYVFVQTTGATPSDARCFSRWRPNGDCR